jgi:steroid 5-alpha reductase family enzyme
MGYLRSLCKNCWLYHKLSGEISSDTQHKKFKDDPKDTGKLYAVGFFQFARNVNYSSNLIRRVVYAVASG